MFYYVYGLPRTSKITARKLLDNLSQGNLPPPGGGNPPRETAADFWAFSRARAATGRSAL